MAVDPVRGDIYVTGDTSGQLPTTVRASFGCSSNQVERPSLSNSPERKTCAA